MPHITFYRKDIDWMFVDCLKRSAGAIGLITSLHNHTAMKAFLSDLWRNSMLSFSCLDKFCLNLLRIFRFPWSALFSSLRKKSSSTIGLAFWSSALRGSNNIAIGQCKSLDQLEEGTELLSLLLEWRETGNEICAPSSSMYSWWILAKNINERCVRSWLLAQIRTSCFWEYLSPFTLMFFTPLQNRSFFAPWTLVWKVKKSLKSATVSQFNLERLERYLFHPEIGRSVVHEPHGPY